MGFSWKTKSKGKKNKQKKIVHWVPAFSPGTTGTTCTGIAGTTGTTAECEILH